jgi:small subunit ribosomal protein S6
MNRDYEALVILKTTGTDAELTRVVGQLEEPIKKLGGQIERSTSWGRRRLAYQIARQNEGHYQLVQFRIVTTQLDELKRLFRLNEAIVRFLILNRADHQPAA